MASKTLSARESIEAAFDGVSKSKLRAAEIIAHVEANSKSKITKGTIRTQLQVQSKKGDWIKRVAPGTFALVAQKATVAVGDQAIQQEVEAALTPRLPIHAEAREVTLLVEDESGRWHAGNRFPFGI